MTAPHVVTLGCRLNTFESEVIRTEASAAGLNDAVIVNTCAVTGEAVRQARQTIRRLRRDHPGRPLVVTGCAAQLDAEAFAAMPEVDRVLGNTEKLDRRHLADTESSVQVSDIMGVRETAGHLLAGFEGRIRTFVEVQQGCDHRCTFCIIPFARGPNRSVSPDRIVERVRALVENGYAEVVLTGVDVCSYGADAPGMPRLGALARRLLNDVPELPRLRLTTLDPAAIDDDLFRLLAEEPRLMAHLHLSLQAADDGVLKRMRRRHSRTDAAAVIARARRLRPETVFGADLIAGFPTETEEQFANTLSAVGDLDLVYLHVFPYSPRPGTPAARMSQIQSQVRKQRAARLREAGDAARRVYFTSRVGTGTEVLIEDGRTGRGWDYAPVSLDRTVPPGAIVHAEITGAGADQLFGTPAG